MNQQMTLTLKNAEIAELKREIKDQKARYEQMIEGYIQMTAPVLETLEFYANAASWKYKPGGEQEYCDSILKDDLDAVGEYDIGGKKAREALKVFKEKLGVKS